MLAVMGPMFRNLFVVLASFVALSQCGWCGTDAPSYSRRVQETATVRIRNRDIVRFHSTMVGNTPAQRADVTTARIEEFLRTGQQASVTTRSMPDGVFVLVNGKPMVFISNEDVDTVAGESIVAITASTARTLDLVLSENLEQRSLESLIWSIGRSIAATLALVLCILLMRWLNKRVAVFVHRVLDKRITPMKTGETKAAASSLIFVYIQRGITVASWVVGFVLSYGWLAYVLRCFPYTRPWGEELRGYLWGFAAWFIHSIVLAIPGVFTVVVILLTTRFAVQIVRMIFERVQQRSITIPFLDPETASPTRRIITWLMWALAIVMAYPYLPGSNSDAFKGVSVLIGLMISMGSSGVVSHATSGLIIMYSKFMRVGEFVRIGEVEGSIVNVGLFAVRLRTSMREDVVIPNSAVMASRIVNYSRPIGNEGLVANTSVTIGYDAPWRTVHALLLAAASATQGVSTTPEPFVAQTALDDFYVRYVLWFSIDDARQRLATISALHANIQDNFNERGLQIMSPHYFSDPREPKVVPRANWGDA
jgi:small-conductance mechanosensitive channel